jgi:hypothetical protein
MRLHRRPVTEALGSSGSPRGGSTVERLWAQAEPLWVAALALLIILPGYQFGARIIQALGRGGQQETVEWLTYLSVLVGVPVGVFVIVRLLPRISPRAQSIVKVLLLLFVLAECVFYLGRSQLRVLGIAAALSLVTVALVGRTDHPSDAESPAQWDPLSWITLTFVGIVGWMGAAALVAWTDATSWFLASPGSVVVVVLAFAISVLAIRATFRTADRPERRSGAVRLLTLLCLVALLALSFRTNPVLDLYHWEAYVGPMQALRQGAWLLWDAPAQYGVLPILLPTLLPGNAWQSFYLFQALCNAAVAFLMFRALGGSTSSVARIVLATALTATTLFFRPREGPLLLAGQMTPSGGPVRFIWPFVMLAFVCSYYRKVSNGDADAERAASRFEDAGNLIWLASVCWSIESAIYCSGVWFPAYLLSLIGWSSRVRRGGGSWSDVARRVLRSIAMPVGALLLIVAAVTVLYRASLGHSPDWTSYFEYALLYSGGFRALAIDPSGSIWFLLIVFLAISTAAVVYISRDPLHPRVMVLAGAWGGIWALSSYYVSRSHPANLLSIATFLVFAAGLTLRVVAGQRPEAWHGLLRVAILPLFVIPVALTFGHPQFMSHIATPQLSYGSFTEQIPLMEPSLNDLLLEAGARPSDPVVRIGDGRLMLPAWRPRDAHGPRAVSPYSWLPKQYEIIGTLPPERRRKYIARLAEHLRLSGWLVHSKTGGIRDFNEQLADIQRTHSETRRFENSEWIVSWYQVKQ